MQSIQTPPKMYRATTGRVVAGVARGLADHLGVNVRLVRAAFIVLVVAGGAGIAMYAAFWAFVPTPPWTPTGRRERIAERGQFLALLALTIGGVLALESLGLGLPGSLLWPLALTGFGAAMLFRQADDLPRSRWRSAVNRRNPSTLLMTLVGAALVIAGGATFLGYRHQLGQVRTGLVAVLVTIAGFAVIAGPWSLGTFRALTAERRARIREQERAELAAHLHDSVLHTLALIQRRVDDPREVQRLARSQERELRTWLYRAAPAPQTDFGSALERVVAEVEEAHGVPIEVVVVGNCPLDDGLRSMLQAAREAMVNAAKHAKSETLSVYAEAEAAKVTVFVRDRGLGFDLDAVPDDRLGVKESIIGRMERHAGKAFVRTAPGAGTEVQLEMVPLAAAKAGGR